MDNARIKLLSPTLEPWTHQASAKQIAVLMSGGVDSSVTAMLLKEAGWNVLGITMKLPLAHDCDRPGICCGAEAGLVSRQIGICHYFLDVQEAFERLVIEPFRQAYMQGRTPSPCVDCNALLKLGLIWDFLKEKFGIRHLATGHYARIVHTENGSLLARAADTDRDQSYFLYGIHRDRLADFVLPLGELSKQEVRELARKNGLDVAEKQDSMELCFAGAGNYRRALGQDIPSSKGPILDTAGKVLGYHEGIFNYTLGQRRGLGIAAGEPRYVIHIGPEDNSVTLGTYEQACRRDVRVEEVNVLVPEKLQPGEQLLGQIRSGGRASACTIMGVRAEATLVEFAKAQFAPCSGQRLVLYDDNGFVVAGGTISYTNNHSVA